MSMRDLNTTSELFPLEDKCARAEEHPSYPGSHGQIQRLHQKEDQQAPSREEALAVEPEPNKINTSEVVILTKPIALGGAYCNHLKYC
jgi:hypothetical protein